MQVAVMHFCACYDYSVYIQLKTLLYAYRPGSHTTNGDSRSEEQEQTDQPAQPTGASGYSEREENMGFSLMTNDNGRSNQAKQAVDLISSSDSPY